jgi:hypothetical protein
MNPDPLPAVPSADYLIADPILEQNTGPLPVVAGDHTYDPLAEPPPTPEPGDPDDLPDNLPDLARKSCRELLHKKAPDGEPLVPEFATTEEAYLFGCDIGVTMLTRFIPGPNPTDGTQFALENLWVHQRHVLGNLIKTRLLIEEQTKVLDELQRKAAEYAEMFPADGMVARIGRMGRRSKGEG